MTYTEQGGNVRVYLNNRRLIIENECVPVETERIADLFEPFYRLPPAYSKNTEENGLGLYITVKILNLLAIRYSFLPTASPLGMRFVIDLSY